MEDGESRLLHPTKRQTTRMILKKVAGTMESLKAPRTAKQVREKRRIRGLPLAWSPILDR